MFPSPSELQYFLEVSQTLNVSRAAERLGVSQPTLSLAIQRLEQTVGAKLLIRSKSGVQLTHAGQKLMTQARHLIEEWERVRTDAVRCDRELSGCYTLGCHPSVALYSLPGLVGDLLAENPTLELRLQHNLSRRITEDVISFKIDFGIVVNPVSHPDLVIRQLCQDEVQLWTAADPSPLQEPRNGSGVLIADLDLLQSQSILKQLGKAGFHFNRTLTSSSLEVIAALVASKAGVGILPGRVAQRIPSFQLKPVGKASPRFEDRICLIYRADAQTSRAARALAAQIEKHFATNEPRSGELQSRRRARPALAQSSTSPQ